MTRSLETMAAAAWSPFDQSYLELWLAMEDDAKPNPSPRCCSEVKGAVCDYPCQLQVQVRESVLLDVLSGVHAMATSQAMSNPVEVFCTLKHT